MWILPVLLLIVQHSTGNSIPPSTTATPNEESHINVAEQSQCSSYCLQCEEITKNIHEKDLELTNLQAQLNNYQVKVSEMELLLNYSNTIRESLLESQRIQAVSKEHIGQIITLQTTIEFAPQRPNQNSPIQLEEDQRKSLESRIRDLEDQLETQDKQIKEKEALINMKRDDLKEKVKWLQTLGEEWREDRAKWDIKMKKLSYLISTLNIFIRDPHVGLS